MSGSSLHIHEAAGVEMIVAIDSTARGPALGGCRWRPYPDLRTAREDARGLARAMTRKAALAGLALGGGKGVVRGDPRARTPEQVRAFGDLVDSLEGRYITAADMGTGEAEMAVIRERTEYVAGVSRSQGGCGSPSPFTAEGVLLAMQAALACRSISIGEAVVAVQGAGSVGSALVRHLVEAGARVHVADTEAGRLALLPPEADVVEPDAILSLPCDVFAPCGPPGVIDRENASQVGAAIVCGAANNPLRSPDVAGLLHDREVLYVPDFLANAGGLIHLAVGLEGGNDAASRRRLGIIPENLERVVAEACADGVPPAAIAERLALDAVAAGAKPDTPS